MDLAAITPPCGPWRYATAANVFRALDEAEAALSRRQCGATYHALVRALELYTSYRHAPVCNPTEANLLFDRYTSVERRFINDCLLDIGRERFRIQPGVKPGPKRPPRRKSEDEEE